MILAPLRGVTVRLFRRVFREAMDEAGFTSSIQPFVAANAGFDPMRDRELAGGPEPGATPQFIGKDPAALRESLKRIKDAGWTSADLNCGCPFPMVRKKFRGSGLLKTPDTLARMLEAGCEVMGDGAFSAKTRLGVDSPRELASLMPVFNSFPLKFLTIHARTARQMYEGECDLAAFRDAAASARIPVVYNGDAPLGATPPPGAADVMVGRAFVRSLAERGDADALVRRYAEESMDELKSERAVLGRMKELVSYWRGSPVWSRRWPAVKIARTLREFLSVAQR